MAVPSWLVGATLREWLNVTTAASTNTLQDVTPDPADYPGSDDALAIVEAWNGGALRVEGSTIQLLCHGGGHGDGADNAIYTFGNINSNTPAWARQAGSFSAPADVLANVSHYNDGKPSAMHGYFMLVYDPGNDQLIRMGNAIAYGGAANQFKTVDVFDFDTNTWSTKTDSPNVRAPDKGGACWDSTNNRVLYWYGGGGFPYDPLRSFDSDLDSHVQQASGSTASELSAGSQLVFDSSRGHALVLDTVGDKFRLWNDIGNTSAAPVTITESGATGIMTLSLCGALYDDEADEYVFYRGDTADEKSIYRLDPTPYDVGESLSWTITKETPSGGATPPKPAAPGEAVSGRFQFVKTADFAGYIMFRDHDGDVFFFPTRIGGGGSSGNNILQNNGRSVDKLVGAVCTDLVRAVS